MRRRLAVVVALSTLATAAAQQEGPWGISEGIFVGLSNIEEAEVNVPFKDEDLFSTIERNFCLERGTYVLTLSAEEVATASIYRYAQAPGPERPAVALAAVFEGRGRTWDSFKVLAEVACFELALRWSGHVRLYRLVVGVSRHGE